MYQAFAEFDRNFFMMQFDLLTSFPNINPSHLYTEIQCHKM